MLSKLGDKPQIDSKLDELNNEGRSLMKSIFMEDKSANFFKETRKEASKTSYYLNVYGPGGVDRIRLLKNMFSNILKNLVPDHFLNIISTSRGFVDPGREMYDRYLGLDKRI